MNDWAGPQADLIRFEQRQLFFVGGAPRSGTTWLQQMLDAHPDVSCQGEGLLWKELAVPLDAMMKQRGQALEAKNARLFKHTGGYPLPVADDTEFLLGTAILLALRRQAGAASSLAIGEKTPENVFFFPRLRRLFPRARLICIARDPRDVLTSAWHFFRKPNPAEDQVAAKIEFIKAALPSLTEGSRAMLDLRQRYPADCRIVTYEALLRDAAPILADLFRFLGVSDSPAVVGDCLARTSFAALTGGRAAGQEQNGAFLRKGTAGDWTSTLSPEMNALILRELGWMFPTFGWRP
jgi:hypothetical protein